MGLGEILWALGVLAYTHPDMAKDFIMFGIACFLVWRLFSKHFKKVTDILTKLNTTVGELAVGLKTLETNHGDRITVVEKEIKELKTPKEGL